MKDLLAHVVVSSLSAEGLIVALQQDFVAISESFQQNPVLQKEGGKTKCKDA